MKTVRLIALCLATLVASTLVAEATPNIRFVNFKSCVEQSKLGKQEQASFEALKKQMETVLAEKEKPLTELANKLEDEDYLDSLSDSAETAMKRDFRAKSQEFSQLQNQYLQALQQTNFKVVQKLTELVTKAAHTVAEQNKYDVVLNGESAFFANPSLDISSQVVAAMDQLSEKEPSKITPSLEALSESAEKTE